MRRVAFLHHVYILISLAIFSPNGFELYLRINMTSTSPALYILNESPVKIKSVEIQLRISLGVWCTHLTTKLQSGISSPSSAIEVANCMRQTMIRPVE